MTDFRWAAAKRKYGCALLAGGEGKRLGGVNKSLLPAGNETADTLLARTSRILSGTGLPCYLSVAAYELPVPDGWTAVNDRKYVKGCLPDKTRDNAQTADGSFAGPMGGIFACLSKAREDGLAGLFFVPCDAPGFETDVIEKMLPYVQDEEIVVWRTPDGRDQMTFAYYSAGCLPLLEKRLAEGRYKLRGLLEKNAPSTEDGAPADSGMCRALRLSAAAEGLPEERFGNLNTPEDR